MEKLTLPLIFPLKYPYFGLLIWKEGAKYPQNIVIIDMRLYMGCS